MPTRAGEEDAILGLYQKQSRKVGDDHQRDLPRRFHLSNIAALMAKPSVKQTITVANGKTNGNYNNVDVAVFVEERVPNMVKPIQHTQGYEKREMLISPATQKATENSGRLTNAARKRPGASAAVKRTMTPTPSKITQSRDNAVKDVELQDALQQYAMEEFGTPSTFAMQDHGNSGGDAMELEHESQEHFQNESTDVQMEDQDYVYDTFVRQAAHNPTNYSKASTSMDTYAGSLLSGPTNSVGYLVIPESSNSVFFYTPDSDDEDEKGGDWDSEQDDENNENYYQADYPEEEDRDDDGEVWSDDEGAEGGDHDGNWDWEKKKRDWGWDDSRNRGSKTVHSDDEEDEDEDLS